MHAVDILPVLFVVGVFVLVSGRLHTIYPSKLLVRVGILDIQDTYSRNRRRA